MPDLPQAARNAAYEELADTGVMSDEIDRALHAAAAHIAAAERERIAREIDPAKLELLADWFDAADAAKGGGRGVEVQTSLRRWARLLRDATTPEGDLHEPQH